MTETLISFDRHFVLGGKVVLHQEKGSGHKAGLDAVMLAASVQENDKAKLRIVDLGAGVGTAGLCVLHRLPGSSVTLVENNPTTLALAKSTLEDPQNERFKARVKVLEADVTLRGDDRLTAGLTLNMADQVIMNPPFYDAESVRLSPNKTRQEAHVLAQEGLEAWFRTASAILVGGGWLSVIFPANGLATLLSHMQGRFGGMAVFPLYKGQGEEAIRVIVSGQKGSRAPMRLLSGLILHEGQTAGSSRRDWTEEANAVLNGETGLVI